VGRSALDPDVRRERARAGPGGNGRICHQRREIHSNYFENAQSPSTPPGARGPATGGSVFLLLGANELIRWIEPACRSTPMIQPGCRRLLDAGRQPAVLRPGETQLIAVAYGDLSDGKQCPMQAYASAKPGSTAWSTHAGPLPRVSTHCAGTPSPPAAGHHQHRMSGRLRSAPWRRPGAHRRR